MNGILNSSRGAAPAWTTFFGIKQSWSRVYTRCIQNKTANLLQPGRSFARAEALISKKCDIFATLLPSLYRIFLTNSYKFFYKSRNTRGNGKFKVNILKYINKRLAKTDFYRGKRGKSSQFLAVLLHSSCERFFVRLFWRGSPKYFIYRGVIHA